MSAQMLTDEQVALVQGLGLTFNAQQMPNGEVRIRLMSSDGYGYIVTIAGSEGAWQNSHYHEVVQETYVVQQGSMVLVEQLPDGTVDWKRLLPGQQITTKPGIAHNVFLPGKAVIHTVKYAESAVGDWHAAPELDLITKVFKGEEILARCSC